MFSKYLEVGVARRIKVWRVVGQRRLGGSAEFHIRSWHVICMYKLLKLQFNYQQWYM